MVANTDDYVIARSGWDPSPVSYFVGPRENKPSFRSRSAPAHHRRMPTTTSSTTPEEPQDPTQPVPPPVDPNQPSDPEISEARRKFNAGEMTWAEMVKAEQETTKT